MTKTNDIVYEILASMLDGSPEKSYKRLNPALRATLSNCIEADLLFQRDTFTRIYERLRGKWWFGDGAGSFVGEDFYSLACQVGHSSACQSFEAFAGRPGVLWEEDVETPFRLHVGARLTWKGRWVEITSMRKDSLVACSYKNARTTIYGLKVGAQVGGYDSPWVIARVENKSKETWVKLAKSQESDQRQVEKRFIITYDEICEMRRTEKARVRDVLKLIETCDPKTDGPALSNRVNEEHFRHFELEKIRAAFSQRSKEIDNQSKVEAWRSGTDGSWLDVKGIYLRVRDGLVECSNGNSVSESAARQALPIVIANRGKQASLDFPLDHYRIRELRPEGVKVGCILVPWTEIAILATSLESAKAA